MAAAELETVLGCATAAPGSAEPIFCLNIEKLRYLLYGDSFIISSAFLNVSKAFVPPFFW